MLTRDKLRNYQRRAVDFLHRHQHAGLFLDMGLGKTISTLTAVSDLLKGGVTRKILLVAPKRPAQSVWRQEARKWQHTRHLTFKLLMGDERQRTLAMNSSAQIHIINVDNLVWLLRLLKAKGYGTRHPWPYDMLIVDESSMFKTPKSKRFATLRFLVKHFQRRIILTGTPTPKGLLDLWAQIFILDEGRRLSESVTRYKSRFFTPTGYMNKKHEADENAEEQVLALVSNIVLTMRAEDWLELPPTLKQEVYVDLPARVRGQYKKLQEEMFLELEQGDVEALSAASLSSKCWQMANGFMYVEDALTGEKTWQAMHDEKLEALKEIVDGTGGNILVAYWFKPDLARLKAAFPGAPALADCKNERSLNLLIKAWNEGKHKVMFIHPAGAGHGLNLQEGGNTIVFFSMLWGREPYAQVIERIGAARQAGKPGRDHVMVKHIICRDTVDEVMLAAQRSRHTDERRYVTMLRDFHEVQDLLA